MKAISDVMGSAVENGTVTNLSYYLLTFIITGFTIFIFYRLLHLLELSKVKKNLSDKGDPEYSWLPDFASKWIVEKEDILNTPILPIFVRYIILGVLVMFSIPALSFVLGRGSLLFSVLSIVIGFFVMFMPILLVKGLESAKRHALNMELPEYLESFALLKQQQTLFDTAINSVAFAGPTLRPYVEEMILEVQLNPGSVDPYKNFARKIGSIDVQTFMNTMLETVNIDEKLGSDLIAEELKQISRMRGDVYEAVIDQIGSKVSTRNLLLSLPIIVIILAFVFYTIVNIVKDSGVF